MQGLSLPKNSSLTESPLLTLQRGDSPCLLHGLSDSMKAFFIGSICSANKSFAAIICPDEVSAERIRRDLASLFGSDEAMLIPAREFFLRKGGSSSNEYEQRRLGCFARLLSKSPPRFVLLSAECLLQISIAPEQMKANTLVLSEGGYLPLSDAVSRLSRAGYVRRDITESAGEFTLRGGILDIFPVGAEDPVRAEFWGDEIDTISAFSTETQRRTDRLSETSIPPARETLFESEKLANLLEDTLSRPRRSEHPADETIKSDIEMLRQGIIPEGADRFAPLLSQETTVLKYFENHLVFISEQSDCSLTLDGAHKSLTTEIKALLEEKMLTPELCRFCLSPAEAAGALKEKQLFLLETFPRRASIFQPKAIIGFEGSPLPRSSPDVSLLAEDVGVMLQKGYAAAVFCGGDKTARIVADGLSERGYSAFLAENSKSLPTPGTVAVYSGGLSGGFELRTEKLAILTVSETTTVPAKRGRFKKGRRLESIADLEKGDAVVHAAHGIGIFGGIARMKAAGAEKDYIKINYHGADVLYLPVTQLDLVSKYVGGKDGREIKLNKLNSTEWQTTKRKVRESLREMAGELLALYRKRNEAKGFQFSPDCDWQKEFEERFEFEETEDQLRSTREIKADMELLRPMDRLLCGDVGFGKTEVAFRAAFKAVLDKKQVAILAPTTILAMQHYRTAKQRFDGFPVEIELISRFRTRSEQNEIIKKLRRGSIDILIGTHRILGEDVRFFDLGLLVIDEEQRFGVAHKEKLKQKFESVDVLTLSATPIPRTLNMAMSGIRDMSMIEEPPQDRLPVQTFCIEEDPAVTADAIRKEMRRGGSVFYLHNRIDSILTCAAKIQNLVPEARIAVAHGRMDERELAEVFEELIAGRVDVLVCTTIIETGIDLQNCNTLIIENADKMGLSQLYQLRGRVGRSSRRAYSYLTFRRDRVLTEIASKRLAAIRDFTQFGSGFKIAMRDLEIRGAGSILGANQSGHLENVGYDMYLKLLGEAVAEKQGGKPAEENTDCLVDIRIDAFIPESYVESAGIRLQLYRAIAAVRTEEDRSDMLDELIDRFGEPPSPVLGLLEVALLRAGAAAADIHEIREQGENILFFFSKPDPDAVMALVKEEGNRVLINAGAKPYASVKRAGRDTVSTIRVVVNALSGTEKQKG